jgi:hypothetical protein
MKLPCADVEADVDAVEIVVEEEEEVGTVMCTVSTVLNKIGQIIMIFALKYLVRTRRQMWTQQKQWRRRRKVLLWFV